MITCKKISLWILVFCICSIFAETTGYMIVEAPYGAKPVSLVYWIKWTGFARPSYPAPDSGTVYFDRSPGGGHLQNYRYKLTNPWVDTITKQKQDNILDSSDGVKKRCIAFKPSEQPQMGYGVFYCVVGFPYYNSILKKQDTIVSNEFVMMIESPDAVDWIGPKDTISDLTPTFKWNPNSGVPYYHVILSDDVIKIDSTDSGNVNVSGLSAIWQAITPNTQITYGAPDPSHTITADPPPLSPGKKYSWIVLNNYGNHPAFSSAKIKGLPGEFFIRGTSLKRPKPLYPSNDTLDAVKNKKFSFKWTNLDTNANTYKIYAYIGSDYKGIDAKLIAWQTEVSALKNVDTMSTEIDAASILTSNRYVWKVIAVDKKGAGSDGDTTSFRYSAPNGTLLIHTREIIKTSTDSTASTVTNNVGLVQIKVEVLDGSLEAPLLFYTDLDGYLSRSRPTGSYRITAISDGYKNQTRTITIYDGQTTEQNFYLERPDATVFGKVVDEAGKGINLANVYGISDQGDTVTAASDAAGNFILKCYDSDWRLWTEFVGYKSTLPQKITVASGQNYNFGNITMVKNPFTLSGIVKNSSGTPLIGVRVRLYQDGVQINELASTPQTGTFSFSVPSGTYTLTAEKTGFTSYNSSIDILNSRSITISMQPGASVIRGYVYGRTWVSSKYVIAPITNATMCFVKIGAADTFKVQTGSTYGEFNISLPGQQKYAVLSSANGFVLKSVPCTLSTVSQTTQNFYDTLTAFATVSGTVQNGQTLLDNCNVSIINKTSGIVTGSSRSSSNGSFEIRNIADGSYLLNAGKDGFVLDSILGEDTLNVSNGKPSKSSISFYMKIGDKKIKWYSSINGTIKIQSPMIKTLASTDSLTKAGSGQYVICFDANADSVIDVSYHAFSVANGDTVHIDTIPILMTHKAVDSITPVNGLIQLQFNSTDLLDSARVYYKNATASTYAVVKTFNRNGQTYTFNVAPPQDAINLLYYFVGYKGSNVYGYQNETYKTYVKPDKSMLTRLEIVPFSSDTSEFPSSYNISASLRGYYSSTFIENTNLNGNAVTWSLSNNQGCSISKTAGLSVIVATGKTASTSPVVLTAQIDTTLIKLKPGVSRSISVVFNVSGTSLKSITIRRIDPLNPNPITTSGVDKAEFAADGVDNNGKILQISPTWKIEPAMAGLISKDGVFKPSSRFIGPVKIIAQSGTILGEYKQDNSNQGLNVRYMITHKSYADTATNGNGCSIVFPPNIVSTNDVGILDLTKDLLENRIETTSGKYQVVSSDAYEIKQLENIAFNVTKDSINLQISIPEGYSTDNNKLFIGNWLQDSLKWNILSNSVTQNRTVCANLPHFSKYAILAEAVSGGYLKISPNPFSPYVNQGQVNPAHPYYGTCIKFQVQAQKPIYDARIKIFNVVGDLVWSMKISNLKNNVYQIWWDGRSSDRELTWDEQNQISTDENGDKILVLKGDKMCRNGRYFVSLICKDQDEKTHRFMKPVVLMK